SLNSSSTSSHISLLLIRNLAFLEQLVQYRVFLFGLFVVFERLGKVVECDLSFPLLGIVFSNAVIGPGVLIVELEGSIERIIGSLHVLSAQRQPAERRMGRAEVRIGD